GIVSAPPDIIFIVLDTHRADRLGCYGYQRPTSPNLDQFAAQAVLFEQAISPAQWTIPSHASFFTGLYPTAHQVTQSSHSLGTDTPHLVELVHASGYETVAFCNNPLVGILDNGFQRGFEAFYNYGGAVPHRPQVSDSLADRAMRRLRRLAAPIQNYFGRSDFAFSLALYAWLTPIWSRWANFKGQNEQSVQDVVRFLQAREQRETRPLFLFLNLMETHLPYAPPQQFVDSLAPIMKREPAAPQTMHRWNREAYRWAAPVPGGLPPLDAAVLSAMYDAEVAYQDDYLQALWAALAERQNRTNTLTIVVGDHGDGLGEHGFFGHAFTAYQELVHVPLLLHWPGVLPAGKRVPTAVSTRRLFHTVLDATDRLPLTTPLQKSDIQPLSLLEVIHGRDVENGTAVAEIYPPLNFVHAIERRQPELIPQFHCRDMRHAVVQNNHKLIVRSETPAELFDLAQDALELDNLLDLPHTAVCQTTLQNALQQHQTHVHAQRDQHRAGAPLGDLSHNPQLRERLRGLGYLD
ncbi:MAG: sulfatase, partial [Anaerolineales bacterium]|nr:sulfatase [Anaerolineales bacterium]